MKTHEPIEMQFERQTHVGPPKNTVLGKKVKFSILVTERWELGPGADPDVQAVSPQVT